MKMLKKELQRQIIEQREKEFLEKEALGEQGETVAGGTSLVHSKRAEKCQTGRRKY